MNYEHNKTKNYNLLLLVLLGFIGLLSTSDLHAFSKQTGNERDVASRFTYIDESLADFPLVVSKKKTDKQVDIFTHGCSGKLLIQDNWLSPKEISKWILQRFNLENINYINIYGCEFAKGKKGSDAVAYLESQLGVSIAASDNITGIDGDWILEVGASHASLAFPNYKGNLQCVTIADKRTDSCDWDGDGVINVVDLDDDNDGILDSDECNGTSANWGTAPWVWTAGVDSATLLNVGSTGVDITIDVSTTAAGNLNSFGGTQLDGLLGTSNLFGGIEDLAVFFDPDAGQGTSPVDIKLTFSQPVFGLSFLITDIDPGGSTRDDQVTVTSNAPSGSVSIDVISANPTVQLASSNVALAIPGSGSSLNDDRGTVRVNVPDGATEVTIVYEEVGGTNNPSTRGAGFFGELSFCLDTDGDGIANRFDLDSDGDNCPDALEGGGGFIHSNTLNDSLTGSVNALGIPVLAGNGQTVGFALDSTTQSNECDPCNSASSLFEDVDNDGIGNDCDLDNDNDGILDSDECNGTSANWGTAPWVWTAGVDSATLLNVGSTGVDITIDVSTTAAGNLNSSGGTQLDGLLGTSNLFGGIEDLAVFFNPDAGQGTSPVDIKLTFSQPVFGLSFLITDIDPGGTNRDDQVTVTSNAPSGSVSIDVISANPTVQLASSNVALAIPGSGSSLNDDRGTVRVNVPDGATEVTIVYEEVGGTNNPGTRGVGFFGELSFCLDTDGDGIPNYLDLDSDGDNCPDALEGGGGFIHSNTLNDSLTGSVNALGIPVLAGNGQTVGFALDSTTQSNECDPCNSASSLFEDVDNDGIGNDCDLDNDNDGILDSDECNGTSANWGTAPWVWTAGVDSATLLNVGSTGVDITIDVSTTAAGNLNSFGGTQLDGLLGTSNLFGGIEDLAVFFDPDTGQGTSPVDIKLTFSQPVFGLSFLITDIDPGGTNRDDQVTVTSNAPSGSVSIDVISANPTVQLASSNVALAIIGSGVSQNDDRGTVRVNVPDGATEVTIVYEEVGGTNNPGTRGVGFFGELSFCLDTDGDGIPNYLDLDSDGDNCPDALEGGGGFTTANLLNDTLTGGVDTSGIPIAATSSGQSIGVSQDSTDYQNCIVPDSVGPLVPACPTCPVTVCPTADDIDTSGGSYTSCGAPAGYTESGPDANGCYTYTPNGGVTSVVNTCVVAIDSNGNADTTYVTINPPIVPDSVGPLVPACPTCPVTVCPTADDIDTSGGSYTSCGAPAGYTESGPDANGCYTYTPNGGVTSVVNTCVVAIDSNGNADTTYVTINPPIVPDSVGPLVPACPTCPVTVCPTADDIDTSGGSYTSCGAPAGYTESGPDANGCYTYTPNGGVTSVVNTCVVAIDSNGNADTTYVTINPPIVPDSVGPLVPACPTCPVTVCPTADDIDTSGGSYTSCGAPAGYTESGPDANGCYTYTPNGGVTSVVNTCVVAIDSNGNADTTYVTINPPIVPDSVGPLVPACPTCPVTVCPTADDIDTSGGSYTSCGAPAGYTESGPDANGCYTYTPNGGVTSVVNTCVVAIDSNGNADTTYVTINPPIVPDSVGPLVPACPTCPVTVCPTADDIDTSGGSYTSCGAPAGYTESGPDANGCYTYTPNGGVTSVVNTCVVAIDSNGNADTTYVTINPPIVPDSVGPLVPACPTCPVTVCPTADDIDTSGGSYTSCGAPAGYTESGPDANGCYTYTPNGGVTSVVNTCVVAIDSNGNADTTYVTINPPIVPDSVGPLVPACLTCPVTVCPTADDIDTSGGSYTSCEAPAGYTESGPDANGCYTYTPNGSVTSVVNTCVVAIDSNGNADTTYVTIPIPENLIAPLPVILDEFTITKGGYCAVNLYWSTLSEENTSYFYVERRSGRGVYETLGRVASSGHSNIKKEYTYIDNSLPTRDYKTYQYRLRVENIDKSISYSPTRHLALSCMSKSALISAYPNPTQGKIDISLQGFESGSLVELKLYNVVGGVVIERKVDITSDANTQTVLDLSSYSNGLYILQAVDVITKDIYHLKLQKK